MSANTLKRLHLYSVTLLLLTNIMSMLGTSLIWKWMAQLHSQGKAELYFGAVEQECSLKHYEETETVTAYSKALFK